MLNDLSKLLGYLPSIYTDIYCAYHSVLHKDSWHDESVRSDFSRLYYVQEGACHIAIDGVEYIVERQQLILIPAHREFSYRVHGKQPLVKLWCHFNASIGGSSLFDLIHCSCIVCPQDQERMTTLFQQLIQSFPHADPIISQLQQQALMSEILIQFLSVTEYKPSTQFREKRILLERAIIYMETHLDEKITIQKLASLVHMNPNYFIQVFTKSYGVPPLKMFNQIKLKSIMERLEHTDAPISEIAQQMGFQDVSYFSKFTKKYLGVSPRDYRLHRQNAEG